MKYGVAIIGAGNIAKEHILGYLNLKDRCEIKAICDVYIDKAKSLAIENSLKVDIVDDYKLLLKRDDIDIVSICLPPSLHQKVTCDFLKENKNVLCEKPMASSLNEAKLMIDQAEKSTALLSIVSQNRFMKSIMKVKQMLDSKIFGKIVYTRVNSMWYRGDNYYTLWWRGTWEKEGGGCTLNHSVHQIDLMGWLLGNPISIYSTIKNYLHANSEVEDTSLSIIEFSNSIAQLGVSLNDMDEKQEFYIQCENASIAIPWKIRCMKQKENGFPIRDEEKEKYYNNLYNELDEIEIEGHSAQILNFINALDKKEDLIVSAQDGYKALEIITAIYKSSRLKELVHLPLKEDDEFMSKETIIKKMPRFYEKSKSVENLKDGITL
ncbi:MAG: Gfo/Idh/MocA family oxidoreductase [Sphaerochaetaceae bacterium]|nr:Gfo/Idh/MocA family oxidoreductase [Sphaerochaetaceae bacterium]